MEEMQYYIDESFSFTLHETWEWLLKLRIHGDYIIMDHVLYMLLDTFNILYMVVLLEML